MKLVAVLFAVGASVVAALSGGQCARIESKIDYPGNDIRSFKLSGISDQSQLNQCCEACSNDAQCVGFVFHDDKCWIKNLLANRKTLSDSIAGAYDQPLPKSSKCQNIEQDVDYPGNDIRSFGVDGDGQEQTNTCCTACDNDASCRGFVIYRGTCWIKTKLTNRKALAGAYSGAANPLPKSTTCAKVEDQIDYPGNDIRSFSMSGSSQNQLNQCCDACANDGACVGFVFHDNKCWIKNLLANRKTLSDSISGAYDQPLPKSTKCQKIEQDIDYPGNDIRSFDVSGNGQAQTNACCSACSDDASCVGFIVYRGTCWIKNKLANRKALPGAFAGGYDQPLPKSTQCTNIEQDVDYPGNDIRSFGVDGDGQEQTNACCAACDKDTNCRGFVIYRGTCWIKTKLANRNALPGAYSGAANALPTSTKCAKVQDQIDYPGNDIRSFSMTGNTQSQLNQCCDACANDGACVGFVFHSNKCWIKNLLANRQSHSTAITGAYDQPLPASNKCQKIEQDIDYPGNDIRSFDVSGNGQAQTNACCSACSDDASCVGFIVYRGTCWIKNKLANRKALPGAFAGGYDQPLPKSTQCQNVEQDIDYPGNDIRSFGVSGNGQAQTDACCAACANDSGCRGFVVYRGTCWIKNKLANRNALPGAIAGASSGLPTSTKCTKVEDKIDYPGNDIRSFRTTGNAQSQLNECCDACSDDAACVGFVFHSNTCWIKNLLANRQPHSTAITGAYNQPLPASNQCQNIEQDIDYPGNDIRSFGVSGNGQAQTDSCCSACSNDARCRGFVVYHDTCWIKNKLTNRKALPGALAGAANPLPTSSKCANIEDKIDYPGNDIRSFKTTGSTQSQLNQCCDACSDEATCVGFVIHDNTCWIKNALANRQGHGTAISGAYAQPLPTSTTCGNIATGFDYPGNDIRSFATSGNGQAQLDQCCSACTNDVRCAGFVFHDNKCWIKTTMTNKKPLAGCVAATYKVSSSTCSKVALGFDYPGNDIRSFVVNGNGQAEVDACCSACTKDTTCAGFVVHDDTCWIKTVLENKTPFHNCFAGAFTGTYNVTSNNANLRPLCE